MWASYLALGRSHLANCLEEILPKNAFVENGLEAVNSLNTRRLGTNSLLTMSRGIRVCGYNGILQPTDECTRALLKCIYSARVALRTTSLVDLGQIFFSQLQEFADTIFRSIQTLEFERVQAVKARIVHDLH